jgi:predicted ArsR family transcriptional regulator
MESYIIKDIEQVRLLSDPLKLQLVQAFAEGDKTTKQVAAELGESVTKLYRHVDALHAAGLLLITEETRKRGTVERTFRAVARRFEADPSLFSDSDEGQGLEAARDMLRIVEREMLTALSSDIKKPEPEAVFMRLRCKASPQRIAQLRDSLNEWIESAQGDENSDDDDEQAREVGALIAFYPIAED